MMTDSDARALRRSIGGGVILANRSAKAKGYDTEDILLEIIVGLLLLAAHLCKSRAKMARAGFVEVCGEIADGAWR